MMCPTILVVKKDCHRMCFWWLDKWAYRHPSWWWVSWSFSISVGFRPQCIWHIHMKSSEPATCHIYIYTYVYLQCELQIIYHWFFSFSPSRSTIFPEVIPSSLQLGVSTSIVFTFRLLNAADKIWGALILLGSLWWWRIGNAGLLFSAFIVWKPQISVFKTEIFWFWYSWCGLNLFVGGYLSLYSACSSPLDMVFGSSGYVTFLIHSHSCYGLHWSLDLQSMVQWFWMLAYSIPLVVDSS